MNPGRRWLLLAPGVLVSALVAAACGNARENGQGAACSAGQTICGSCDQSGFCSQGCPNIACPMEAQGGEHDAGGGESCPSSSPTHCTDCGGAGFCVAGSCPAMSCPAPVDSSPFPLSVAGDGGDAESGAAVTSISAQCAALPPRPLTAGSYADPETGVTVHWPSGWTVMTNSGNPYFATVTTPVTWVPTGTTMPLDDQATFSISVTSYGNPNQVPTAVQAAASWAAENGGAATPYTLLGHPGALWWDLTYPPEPGCAAGCASIPPTPEILTIGALIQFTDVDAGGGFGVEVDLTGSAREDALPVQVFCDIEAMILGVTQGP